ncbi:MAG: putative Brix domain-containing ribosomal biogenesis protein [Candidatus Thorarchaeota archaeon]|nr:MAG: putative Brix domain-containing ribosomal biogenesis protein [Candidatus Thorarchaeota archaeon]
MFLITTSRRTSNRVRSFVRDLWTVLPGSDKFNRGGMNLAELAARIRQSSAEAALVITMFKGNPGDIQFIDADGHQFLTVRMGSAQLKREVTSDNPPRINSVHSITILSSENEHLLSLASILGEIIGVPVHEASEIVPLGPEYQNMVTIVMDTLQSGKILWTHFHSEDALEIGPRIRVRSILRKT